MNTQSVKEICLIDRSVGECFVTNAFAQITKVNVCSQICDPGIFKWVVQFVLTEALNCSISNILILKT